MEVSTEEDSSRLTGLSVPALRRRYELWRGNNRFCCKGCPQQQHALTRSGKLIFGPDRNSFIFTAILMTVPTVIYIVDQWRISSSL
jgi:hypothetical protein